MAALKAVLASQVPNLDQVTEVASPIGQGFELANKQQQQLPRKPKFLVIGHRGNGMNKLQSPDPRMSAIKENSILSFNAASRFPLDYIEFDVQVTKDGCPVIFHDDFIIARHNGNVVEKRITELCLAEFLEYGPQRDCEKSGKSLLRRSKDGNLMEWNVKADDAFCTLQETFQLVPPALGFNIELKFDDYIAYPQQHLLRALNSVLQVVFEYAQDRRIIFSSFHPDAAQLVRQLQNTYPVYFLTNGGSEIYEDVRRNSLEEALKLSLECGLQGIVSEAKAVFRNPMLVQKIKDSNLSLLTYGSLNNVKEAVYMQHVMGVDGVIVDFVEEICEAVCDLISHSSICDEGLAQCTGRLAGTRPQFSEKEIAFLFRLIPELIQL
uniref:glycerophosphodiester phosphodiesterase n=1 Tax=Kalanchoe fedtschenkoi TaxID=63787 RepID=A0A7N0UQ34_KALFE